MAKPIREFNANEGDYSVGIAGPDALENDIDSLLRMFDPLTTHDTGEQGGVGPDNIQDNAIKDKHIGPRTINDSVEGPYINTGPLEKLVSLIARAIKDLKGTDTWHEGSKDNIGSINDRVIVNKDGVALNKLEITNNKNEIIRHIISGDHDDRYVTEEQLTEHKDSIDHDVRYYTKDQITDFLSGGDVHKREEVFIIVSANNGDGTFTYSNEIGEHIIGELTEEGYQKFILTKGYYALGRNRVEVFVNDTLRRSPVSGGLEEVTEEQVMLTAPEDNGAEITIVYFERVGMGGEFNIRISPTNKPPIATGERTVWFEVFD